MGFSLFPRNHSLGLAIILFMNKPLLLLSLLAFSLSSCSSGPGELKVTLTPIEGKACFHTAEQHEFLTSVDPDAYIETHAGTLGLKSKGAPLGVSVAWKAAGKPTAFSLLLSEKEDFSTYETFEAEKSPYAFQNLYLGKTYFYKVVAHRGEENKESEPASFTVEDTPIRNIAVPGMENLRDCGGYAVSGGKIKQGMLYRSGELNPSSYSSPCRVNAEGLAYMKKELGIRGEIDLRKTLDSPFAQDEVDGITASPLGEGVDYFSCPMEYRHINPLTNPNNLESVRSFFSYLSVPEHYPLVYHCVRGTDRTGALGYAIGALCGMSETDLMRDYLFSDFANIGSSPIRASEIAGEDFYVQGIHDAEGESMSEKAENYLVSTVGVERDTLSAIKNILMEK